MKIVIINPRDSSYSPKNGLFSKSISYAPLTLTLLAALVPKELTAEIEIIDEGVDERQIDFKADIIAISVLTATAKRAYSIAKIAKEQGSYVVMGGIHTTLMPDEVSQYADTIICGQSENNWPIFLRDFKKGIPKPIYQEVREVDLKNIPIPMRDLQKNNKYLPVTTVQASRGCPNKCNFCAISFNLKNRKLQRPINEVINEIKKINKKEILFLDPNFFADNKYSNQLMIKLKELKISWGCLSNASIGLDENKLKLMERSGCKGVLVGFESICQNTLARIHKNFNQSAQYVKIINGFHRHKIGVLGCFVFGFDTDDISVFNDTVEFVLKSGIDLPRFSVLTPFPGTPIFNALNKTKRIFDFNWDHYDFQKVVFEPKLMTKDQLQNGLYDVWKKCYQTKIIIKRGLNTPSIKILGLLANLAFKKYGDSLRHQTN